MEGYGHSSCSVYVPWLLSYGICEYVSKSKDVWCSTLTCVSHHKYDGLCMRTHLGSVGGFLGLGALVVGRRSVFGDMHNGAVRHVSRP